MPPTVPLDPDQQAAVDHREGACLVLAGPGSGKTRVIVERFLALVEAGVPASRQLVLTYTIRAAAEMRERAERARGSFDGDAPLLNFHSFGRRVLREWGWLVGVAPGFRVADAAEQWLHLEAVLEELRPRTLWNPLRPHDLVEALLDLMEKAKQELVTPDRYAGWARTRLEADGGGDEATRALLERHAECAAVYAALQERMRRHALLDHDDCILLADTVLREHPAARAAICGAAEFVMVDEFQDTNLAQARLVETLTAGRDNLLVVADDDQSIYKFRGASLANLDRFGREHPDHRRITLGRNYRSTRPIVTACRALIGAAADASRIPKTVEPARGDGVEVEVWKAPDTRSESLAVARACRGWVEESALAYSEIAWLFRRHEDMRAAMAALQEAGVPYRVHGGRGYFQQPEIKDLLAVLAVVDEPRDSQAFIRCLHHPTWRVSSGGRVALVRAAAADERPLTDVLRDEAAAAAVLPGAEDAAAARRCADDVVDLHALAQHADVRDVLFEALERSGYVGGLEAARDLERAQVGANLSKLAELLDAFADWATDIRLRPALRYLEVLRDSGEADRVAPVDVVEDGVVLLTAHGAKGLEWPVVVVGGCTERRWPGRPGFADRLRLPDELVDEPAPTGDTHVDEERRLLYVAATRARDRLVLTWAVRTPQSYEDERPTPFLDSVLGATSPPRMVDVPFAPPLAERRRATAGAPVPRVPAAGVRDLRDFKECPRRYEYRRRYRMPVRPSVQAWYGTLVHAALERAGRLRCAGSPVGAEELSGIWAQTWEGARQGFRGARPELRGYGEDSLRRYAESEAWAQARPVAVEQPFRLSVEDGVVTGRFDRIDQPRGGVPVVVDYKTGPPRGLESAQRDLQVRAYGIALARQEGVDEIAVELHHLQTAEVTRIEIDEAFLRRAGGQISATVAELSRAWHDRRFPPNAAPHRCRRCDFRTVCDEGRAAIAEA
jgi:superfamily I DNA/RNA helicase/RecB family exonuclease